MDAAPCFAAASTDTAHSGRPMREAELDTVGHTQRTCSTLSSTERADEMKVILSVLAADIIVMIFTAALAPAHLEVALAGLLVGAACLVAAVYAA